MRTYFLIFLGLGFLGMRSTSHAFYISILDIQYYATEQKLEVQYKIFTDDLESGIRAWEEKPIALQDGIDAEEQKRIYQFLQAKTNVKLNNKSPELEVVACENEGDATFIKCAALLAEKPSFLEVQCSLLVDIFPNQRNVVRYKAGKMQKMLSLGKGKENGEVKLGK